MSDDLMSVYVYLAGEREPIKTFRKRDMAMKLKRDFETNTLPSVVRISDRESMGRERIRGIVIEPDVRKLAWNEMQEDRLREASRPRSPEEQARIALILTNTRRSLEESGIIPRRETGAEEVPF